MIKNVQFRRTVFRRNAAGSHLEGPSVTGATRTLIGLLLGLAIGALLKALDNSVLIDAARQLAPLGVLWLTALRMTLVPLVFSMVVLGVSAWTGAGRIVGQAFAVFAALLVLAAATGAGFGSLVLRLWPVAPGVLIPLAAAGPPPATPPIVDQLAALMPVNPVAAAAEGAGAPLVMFALLFGLALARIAQDRRLALSMSLQAVADTMMVIVGAVLRLAPVGVFVLGLGVALNTGLKAAGVLGQALAFGIMLPILGIGICYLVARFAGGVGFARFARAALGPQVMAAGTTSSLATLPAMIEAAETKLDCPPALAGAVLPLAVSTFRFGNVVMVSSMMMFAAAAAGVHPSLGQILIGCVVVILTNLGVAGLPAAAMLYAADAPAFLAVGAPLDILPLLIAIAAIPDIFDTMCNVTGDLAATTVVQRWVGASGFVAAPVAVSQSAA